ncbi:MAG: hypothetical protein Q9203_003419 [Teloschistes exilis]
MLESSNIKTANSTLQSVIALSSRDPLYIAKSMLSDPAHGTDSRITRIRGNIGRAGIALLVPPETPRVMTVDLPDWRLLDHDEYDGATTNCFAETSSHAFFTGSMLPFDTGSRGMRDTDIYLFETTISARDQGGWIGDIKPLPMFNDPLFRVINADKPCQHQQKSHVAFAQELIATDSWYQFFTRPGGPIYFRACGNWMARLAAASMSVQHGHPTFIFGNDVCWTCGKIEYEPLAPIKKPIFIP